jgi:hypothetical protein
MPEKPKHRMKTNKTKNTTQKPKRLPVQMTEKSSFCVLVFLASVLVIF